MEPDVTLPEPGLGPRPITIDQYIALTPEKLELISGYLIDDPDAPEWRLRLLRALLVNCGLTDTVKLAPRELWLEALDRAYPSR